MLHNTNTCPTTKSGLTHHQVIDFSYRITAKLTVNVSVKCLLNFKMCAFSKCLFLLFKPCRCNRLKCTTSRLFCFSLNNFCLYDRIRLASISLTASRAFARASASDVFGYTPTRTSFDLLCKVVRN